MNSKEILQADMLDILFENRNKFYGAYTLRKFYNRRLMISLGIALSSVLLMFFLMGNKDHKSKLQQDNSKEVFITDFKIQKLRPEIPPFEKTASATKQKISQQTFVDNVKLVNREVATPMPAQNRLINISDNTMAGPDIKIPYVPGLIAPGNKKLTVQQSAPVEAPIQREPEFPGGIEAWTQFLRDYLQVPGQLEPGERRTVLIRFLVAVNGEVTGFEVLQSGGRIYDNEVIRVLKRMPRWKPAIQNNRPVSRPFTQPVIFMGLEE